MSSDIKKIVQNAAVNAELENKKLTQETIDMIESCLKTKNGSFLFHLYLRTKGDGLGYGEEILEGSKNSRYCYDNGVLINNYGIRDMELLHIVESDVAAFYQSEIVSGNSKYKFSFDVNSYLALHYNLFSSIYSFAGEIRDEFIYKSCEPYLNGKTPFCLPQNIYNCLYDTLFKMKSKLSTLNTREELIDYLSYYYGELNMIHPFREGNGRTLRTYILLLVDKFFDNFEIDYSLWDEDDKERLIKGTIINSVNGNIDDIRECFDKVLVEKRVKKRVKSINS